MYSLYFVLLLKESENVFLYLMSINSLMQYYFQISYTYYSNLIYYYYIYTLTLTYSLSSLQNHIQALTGTNTQLLHTQPSHTQLLHTHLSHANCSQTQLNVISDKNISCKNQKHNKSYLNIYLQNTRSIRGKTVQFKLGLLNANYDIVAITETWLTDGIFDAEVSDDRYDVHRCDRSQLVTGRSRGGGVMLLTKRHLSSQCDSDPRSADEAALFDSVHVTIPGYKINSRMDLHIICIYIPGSRLSSKDQALDGATAYLDTLCKRFPQDNYLILGDFNIPHLKWESNESKNYGLSPTGLLTGESLQQFLDFTYHHHLEQYNSVSNDNGKFLDLVFSNTYTTSNRATLPILPEDLPHHPALTMTLSELSHTPISEPPRRILSYKNADYANIQNYLDSVDWKSELQSGCLNAAVDLFYSRLYVAIDEYVPSYYLAPNKYPSWYSKSLIHIIKEKKKYHRLWKKFRNPRDQDCFVILRKRQKRVQKQCWERCIQSAEVAITKNPKHFWRYAKQLKWVGSIPNQLSCNGTKLGDPAAICEGFLNYFQSNYKKPDPAESLTGITFASTTNRAHIGYINIDEDLVYNYLIKIDINKGPGSDNIHPVFAKKCSRSLALPLSILLSRSLYEGIFPEKWKEALIVPVHKGGSKTEIEKYRPISILSVFSKLIEKIVYDQIYPNVKNVIPYNQHGFMNNRSVTTNLAIFTDDILRSMDKEVQVDTIYTDYAKCFDRLNHKILLHKLERAGIYGKLLVWSASYLKNRSQIVKIGSHRSTKAIIPSGIPQGSHLGPLFFNIYIHDISECFKFSNFIMYADDQKIYLPITQVDDCFKLQEDLNRLCQYCILNSLDLNVNKCHLMTYTRKTNIINFNYSLFNKSISKVSIVRDLGVLLDGRLTYIDHYENIIRKANKMLGFVLRTTKPFKGTLSLRTLYFAYVRSILEFASSIWSPSYATHANRIENVQKKFLNAMKRKDTNANVNNILTLGQRRLIADSTLLFDIINNKVDCPPLLERLSIEVPNPRLRRRPRLFHEPPVRTNYAGNSFINRSVRNYNLNCLSIDIFNINKSKFQKELCNTFTNDI